MPASKPPGPPPRPPATATWRQFGDALRELRLEVGLSIESVAEKNPMLSKSTISECELGTRKRHRRTWEWAKAAITICLTHANYSDYQTELTHWKIAWEHATKHSADDEPRDTEPMIDDSQHAPPDTEAPSLQARPHTTVWPPQGRWWIAGTAAAVIATAAVGVLAATTNVFGISDPLPFAPDKTHTQIANSSSSAGAKTFKDPRSLTGPGQNIANGNRVQVSCKIASPSAASVGIYWYRIASPPWNNDYYSPANSFLNGGGLNGSPNDRDVDPAVPDCPQ